MRFPLEQVNFTMRIVLSLLAAVALAASASAAAPPTCSVAFTGSGSEHQLDHQQNIQDSGQP
jgi:hypothetical protein